MIAVTVELTNRFRNSSRTVLSAPTGADLRTGMAAVARDAHWRQLDGYVSLEANGTDTLETRAVNQMRFVQTQPLSLENMRLIAANWLSSNILAYAALFCLLAVLLGLATSRLLSRFGRRD